MTDHSPSQLQLFGGNFDEWLRGIEPLYMAHSLGRVPLQPLSKDPAGNAPHSVEKKSTAVVTHYASPTILASIPLNLQQNVHTLLPYLRKLSAPFRLMALPPELRTKIYEFALQSSCVMEFETLDIMDDSKLALLRHLTLFAPLCMVSPKLYDETLPVYLSTNTFKIGDDELSIDGWDDLDVVQVADWAHSLGVHLKHVRCLTVTSRRIEGQLSSDSIKHPAWRDQGEVAVTYDARAGELRVSTSSMTMEQQVAMQERAREVTQYAAEHKTKGELVALFFTDSVFWRMLSVNDDVAE